MRKDWCKIGADVPVPTKVEVLKTLCMLVVLTFCLCILPSVHVKYVTFYANSTFFPPQYLFILYKWGVFCSAVMFVTLLYMWSKSIRLLFMQCLAKMKESNSNSE